MKKINIDQAKQIIDKLVGRKVTVKQNRGRNRIKHYVGTLDEVYENIFVVHLENDLMDRLSCAYSDLICGEISLKEYTK